jgi:hypothetical protein
VRPQVGNIANELQCHPRAPHAENFWALAQWTISAFADVFKKHAAHRHVLRSLQDHGLEFDNPMASYRARKGN